VRTYNVAIGIIRIGGNLQFYRGLYDVRRCQLQFDVPRPPGATFRLTTRTQA
jgi:hypothetical protein